jgi:hypothetical protein
MKKARKSRINFISQKYKKIKLETSSLNTGQEYKLFFIATFVKKRKYGY